MKSSFLSLDGFFVSWSSRVGECRVFTKSKGEAQNLFSTLKSQHPTIELHKIANGQMEKIA